MLEQFLLASDDFGGDDEAALLLGRAVGQLVQDFEHDVLDDRAQAAGAVSRALAFLAISASDSGVNSSSQFSIWKNLWYCFTSAFLGSVMMRTRASTSSGVSGQTIGRRPTNSGIMPNSRMSSLVTWASSVAQLALVGVVLALSAKADGLAADAAGDDVFQADEGAAADEQDVGRVHLDVLLLGMLAAALGRHVGDGAFEHLEEGLLNAFARDVAGDGDVVVGLADLVDLVDVDDAALGGFEVEVGGVEELEQDILDVFADVAGLGEGGGVADGEGDVEHAGEGLGQQGLAAAGGADQEDVGLVELDVGWSPPRRAPAACSGYGRRRRGPSWRGPGR